MQFWKSPETTIQDTNKQVETMPGSSVSFADSFQAAEKVAEDNLKELSQFEKLRMICQEIGGTLRF